MQNVFRVATLVCFFALFHNSYALRVYLIGNSVTDGVNYAGFKAIAEAKGFTHVWNRHMIPGAPLEWLWQHRTEGFTESPFGFPENACANYDWDAMTLQPFDRHLDSDVQYGGEYMKICHARSPNFQAYIYSRYPRTPNDKAPTDATLTADTWEQLWARTYTGGWDGTNESKDYFERLVAQLRITYAAGYKPTLIIPVGDIMREINTRGKNGLLSAYSIDEAWDLYSDGIHLSNVGSYLVGLTFFATIYKTDPRGMSVPSNYGTIASGLVSVIQEIVWGVVSTHPLAGVSGNVSVQPARASQQAITQSITAQAFELSGRRVTHTQPRPGVYVARSSQGTAIRTVRTLP